MGNCIRKTTSTEWGGEDWGSFWSANKTRIHGPENMNETKSGLAGSLPAGGAEVKIKISKKELERLLKEADIEGLPVQQVLAQLMNTSHHFEATHQQHAWRPALYIAYRNCPEVIPVNLHSS